MRDLREYFYIMAAEGEEEYEEGRDWPIYVYRTHLIIYIVETY